MAKGITFVDMKEPKVTSKKSPYPQEGPIIKPPGDGLPYEPAPKVEKKVKSADV